MNKYNYTFPECFNDEKDIFRYVNAIEDSQNKKELDPERDEEKLSNLRNEIYGESKNIKYRIIICLGDFAYFAVRAVLGKYEGREKHRYGSKAKYSIKKIGEHFSANSKVDTEKEVYILPILHNSANRILDLDKLREFTPEDEREDYISYYCYIGECLGKILINDINRRDEYKEYLKRLK